MKGDQEYFYEFKYNTVPVTCLSIVFFIVQFFQYESITHVT